MPFWSDAVVAGSTKGFEGGNVSLSLAPLEKLCILGKGKGKRPAGEPKDPDAMPSKVPKTEDATSCSAHGEQAVLPKIEVQPRAIPQPIGDWKHMEVPAGYIKFYMCTRSFDAHCRQGHCTGHICKADTNLCGHSIGFSMACLSTIALAKIEHALAKMQVISKLGFDRRKIGSACYEHLAMTLGGDYFLAWEIEKYLCGINEDPEEVP